MKYTLEDHINDWLKEKFEKSIMIINSLLITNHYSIKERGGNERN